MTLTLAAYREGIERAKAAGIIVVHQELEDKYSHVEPSPVNKVPTIWSNNCRSLDDVTNTVLNSMRDVNDLQALELGTGVGKAISDVARIRPDSRITAVSLTPVNPYWSVELDINGIKQKFVEAVSKRLIREKYFVKEMIYLIDRVPFEFLLRAQRGGILEAFKTVEEPYVQEQHIGDFRTVEAHLERERYHIVHSDNGALRYTPKHVVKKTDDGEYNYVTEDGKPSSCKLAYQLTRKDGVLIARNISDRDFAVAIQEDFLEKGDVLIHYSYSPDNILVARAESRVAKAFREFSGRRYETIFKGTKDEEAIPYHRENNDREYINGFRHFKDLNTELQRRLARA